MRKLSLATVLVLMLAMAPAAQAKSPPKGKYECVIGSANILFGTITIKSGGKYRYTSSKKTGTFTAGKKLRTFSGTKGYSIRFKGGGLNKYKGYWFKSTSGTHEIALENPRDGFVSIRCDD